MVNIQSRGSGRGESLSLSLGCLILTFVTGCPGALTPPDGGNNGEGPGQTTARIVSPASSFGISLLDPAISVIYTVPAAATDISGYFVQVENASPASDRVADPVVTVVNLPAGAQRVFNFNPQDAGVGFFRVGVLFTFDGRELFAESQGVIQVQGSPSPVFVFPDQPVTSIEQGAEVFISFDTQDSDGRVNWRLFRLAEGQSRTAPPDQLGTQLAAGSGSAGTFTMATAGLLPGDYQLGLSATDSGLSIAATVSRGELDRIVTIPNANADAPIVRIVEPNVLRPPTISVTAPPAGDVVLFQDDPFTLRFEGRILEVGAQGTLDVFRDNDTNPTNGLVVIRDDLPASTQTLPFPTNTPEGAYFIGATIRDGINAPVTAYAPGKIIVIRTVLLEVIQPTSPLPVSPGTAINVAWTTNAPPTAGTIDVFARSVDNSGQPIGNEIPILTGGELAGSAAQFTSNVPGRFQIAARANIRDGSEINDTAPAIVRFSSLPGIIWLGELAESGSEFEGAVFGGANFEDNAGTSFTTAGDLDGDGLDEFIVSSRYGKPYFINPSGVGSGEAYIIYGRAGASKVRGEYNLNSVGTSLLTGLTITGIQTSGNSDQTDGMSDITQIPDADYDGRPELAFGFPFVDSTGVVGPLTLPGQFRPGGVVILSSNNEILANPLSFVPVINLDFVGMIFSDFTILPTDPDEVVDDFLRFNPQEAVCLEGADQLDEQVIGPGFGFIEKIDENGDNIFAAARWRHSDIFSNPGPCPRIADEGLIACDQAWDPFIVGEPGAPDSCETGICTPITGSDGNAGSGFYPANAVPGQPRGARILGQQNDDKFGTSIAISTSFGFEIPGDLIISAPQSRDSAGEGYLVFNRNLWAPDEIFFANAPPPRPHQYIIDEISHCGDDRAPPLTTLNILGQSNDEIENILGIDDFNGDARPDFVVGAPNANNGNGRVYIAFRREEAIEGDYELGKLGLHPQLPERLTGMLITSTLKKGLGESLASGVDFNGDGISDLVIGAPRASNFIGEVIIVFGETGIVTPEGGYNVEELLRDIRTESGGPVAVRIKGSDKEMGLFGYNVANAGDVDGDGLSDLLIAAPQASPRFDPDPNDSIDELTTLGIDRNLDGVADEVPGDNRLLQAGLVYVVYGSNRLDQIRACANTGSICGSDDDCEAGESCITKDFTVSIEQLGHGQLRGFIIAGRRGDDGSTSGTGHRGDRIGGGDAGDTTHGGTAGKAGRGRSHGLASAGDVDGDGRDDILIGSVLADPRRDPTTQVGVRNGGEAYLIYGSAAP